MGRTLNVVKLAIAYTAVVLAHFGLVDEQRGQRVADLAWPRVVTGIARKSKTTADLAMVGLAIGPAAIAGVGFALAFYTFAMSVGYSLANGAMTFLSQRYGAGDMDGVDLAVKQTMWIELLLAGLIAVLFIAFARPLIGLLGAAPDALAHGTLYLQVTALALFFEMPNKLGSRALISANDAWSPMVIRTVGAFGNMILNVVFIFGLGMGVFGAALGTVVATVAVAIAFTVGMTLGRLPWIGELPIQVSLDRPYFDATLTKQLLKVSLPLMAKRLVSRVSNFAMLAIVAYFGTVVVAAYAVAREIRKLMNTPGWGFGTAARSLVGQELGADEELEAEKYGWDLLRFTVVIYVIMAIITFVFAEQIAPLFTNDPEAVATAVPFIMVMAVSLVGLGVDSTASGIISAAGDTRWPFYARLLGLYVFMIPIAYLGVSTSLGIVALYIAITAETVVPAVITYYRFTTDEWKVISRQYRHAPSD